MGATVVIGGLLAQVFGIAPAEEIGYRGFMLPQLYLLWSGRFGRNRAIFSAIVVSQILFALMHVPIAHHNDLHGIALFTNLLRLFWLGLLFAMLYLLTDNLFVAMAFHALSNTPTPLIATSLNPHDLIFALELIFLLYLVVQRFRRRPAPQPTPAIGL